MDPALPAGVTMSRHLHRGRTVMQIACIGLDLANMSSRFTASTLMTTPLECFRRACASRHRSRRARPSRPGWPQHAPTVFCHRDIVGTTAECHLVGDLAAGAIHDIQHVFRPYQTKFYTACLGTGARSNSTVFAHESPPRSARVEAENGLFRLDSAVAKRQPRHAACVTERATSNVHTGCRPT
jgi:hypothetical protein